MSAPVLGAAMCLFIAGGGTPAMAQGEDLARTYLAEEVELARLVDLCTERLGLNIEYDAATLKGAATLRLGSGVSDGSVSAH